MSTSQTHFAPVEFNPSWTKLTKDNFEQILFELKRTKHGYQMDPRKGFIYIKQGDVWNYRIIWPDLTWQRLIPFILQDHCYTDVLVGLTVPVQKQEIKKVEENSDLDW